MAILSHHPDGGVYATSFSQACVWPDDIRKKPGDHPTWHYRDLAFFDNIEEHPIPHDEENATWALAKNRAILRDPSASDADKAVALSWVGHIVGDVHQPLHATTRCDAVHPDGDMGGNLFPIQIDGVEHANLHKFWDSVALELNPDPTPEGLEAFVNRVEMRYPTTSLTSLTDDHNPLHWLQESYDIAIDHAYPDIHTNQKPSPEYIASSQAMCEKRIALAGYRLAYVVEEALGDR